MEETNNNATTVENSTTSNEEASSNRENKHGVYGKIAERMKDYEKKGAVTEKLNPKEPFMMRLDGHCFSGFANSFNKPFDVGLHEIMVLTTKSLLEEFNYASCGYTQSDEITLVFPCLYTNEELEKMEKGEELPKEVTTKTLPYSGRVLKMSTLAAGICSTKFNHHCKEMVRICRAYEAMLESKQVEEPKDPNEKIFIDLVNPDTNQTEKVRVFWTKTNTKRYDKVMKKLNAGIAYFDARVFSVPFVSELVNNIMWRSNYDCVRNSRMNLARAYFSTKELHKLTARDAAAKLLSEKNVDWATYPAGFKYGTFVKREKQRKSGFNPQTQASTDVERTVLAERSFGFNGLDAKWAEILLARYWNDVNEELLAQTLH